MDCFYYSPHNKILFDISLIDYKQTFDMPVIRDFMSLVWRRSIWRGNVSADAKGHETSWNLGSILVLHDGCDLIK